MNKGRLVAVTAVVGGLAFGAFGGEYRLIDWLQLKRQVQEEDSAVVALQHDVDSMLAYAEALESDSATQERVARERFGMLRDGEIVYLIESRE